MKCFCPVLSLASLFLLNFISCLKDKSSVCKIDDDMKYYTVINGVSYFFQSFFIFSLRNYVLQSATCS